MKKAVLILSCLALLAGAAGLQAADEATSWTGEVLDIACYVPKGAAGADHAACARSCVKNGQPMGLLVDDAVILLTSDHKDGKPYEGLKDHAGETVSVEGQLAEKGGMKMITVTGFKADS